MYLAPEGLGGTAAWADAAEEETAIPTPASVAFRINSLLLEVMLNPLEAKL